MPKTEFKQELCIGLSGGKTANPTTFFFGDQHVLASAGRELYLMRTQSFEGRKHSGLDAPVECKKVALSLECREWMKKNPKAQFQAGKASKGRNFFIFNMDFPGQEIELTAPQVGSRNPVLFFLVDESGGGSMGVNTWNNSTEKKQVNWFDQNNPNNKRR